MDQPLLRLHGLSAAFSTPQGQALAVDSVDLRLEPGEILGLVGESGCGKTVLSLAILGLVQPPGRIIAGQVLFQGRDLRELPPDDLRRVRGADIAMIFQEPMTSLNPVMRVGFQVAEPLMLHRGLTKPQALAKAKELLALVGLPEPERTLRSYPHELSGGMRQRVVIAMALACDPKLLIADEPTTALDVTIQKQILELLVELARARDVSILLITHNLGVVAQTCTRLAVMYSGRIVELSPVDRLFVRPLHPYTAGLMGSLPKLGVRDKLVPIAGMVPSLTDLPPGCHFHPRCPKAFARCQQEAPPLFSPEPDRQVRCWLYAEGAQA